MEFKSNISHDAEQEEYANSSHKPVDPNTLQEKEKKQKKQPYVFYLILCIFIAVILVFVVYNPFGKASQKGKSMAEERGNIINDIVVMDINNIINEKKDEFIEKYKGVKEPSKEQIEQMQKEAEDFANRLNHTIHEESKDKIILDKTCVVSPVEDISDRIRERLGMKLGEKKK